MASKSSSVILIFRRIYMKNVMERFQPRLASAFAASIHTAPVPKWTICDNVLPRMVGAGNFLSDSPSYNCRNYARKPVSKSKSEDSEDFDSGDELDDEDVSGSDDEIDFDKDEVSDDDTKSDED